ncbi:MAG: hypothetical protein R3349_12200 [Geminicoccaceae bacterium]|nr:hypothetical protein [Geminicoccaceae bacterium]
MPPITLPPWTWYWISVAVLTLLLFLPVSRLIWVLAVRRLERRRGDRLTIDERRGQRVRARFLGLLLALLFSALFNYQLLDMRAHL